MQISRRTFLGSAIGSAAVLSWQTSVLRNSALWPEREFDCGLLDLKSYCVLRESLQGYRATLGFEAHHILDIAGDARHRCKMIIVPGAGGLDHMTAQILSDSLRRGTLVLLESGAAFLSSSEFAVHQNILRGYFDVDVGPPVNLWPAPFVEGRFSARAQRMAKRGRSPQKPLPYVNYTWPSEALIRDYSRVIPVSENGGNVIGRAGGEPVAVKRHTDSGLFVFLGSPLGPALAAGDREAHSWLKSLAARINL